MPEDRLKRIYEVVVVDPVWDNWEHEGYYDDLNGTFFKKEMKKIICAVLATELVSSEINLVNRETGERVPKDNIDQWLEDQVEIPDDFLTEYASTFSYCIDRPDISYEEVLQECINDFCMRRGDDAIYEWEMSGCYDPDECLLRIRGFVMNWPEKLVDNLISWEINSVKTYEQFKNELEEDRYENPSYLKWRSRRVGGDRYE